MNRLQKSTLLEKGTERSFNAFCRLWLPLTLVVLLPGCSLTPRQKQGIETFATSTIQLGQVAATNFHAMRARTIQVNSMCVALKADPGDLDGGMTIQETTKRAAAAEALQTYGELLLNLATSKRGDEIQKSFSSMKVAFTRAGAKLSEQQYDALGSVVSGLGNWFLDCKRLKALRRATETTATNALFVTQLIGSSFANQDAPWVNPLTLALNQLKNNAGRVQDKVDSGQTPPEADLLPQARVLQKQTLEWRGEITTNVTAAVKDVDQAYKTVEHLLKYGDFDVTAIEHFAAQIQDLVSAAKLINQK